MQHDCQGSGAAFTRSFGSSSLTGSLFSHGAQAQCPAQCRNDQFSTLADLMRLCGSWYHDSDGMAAASLTCDVCPMTANMCHCTWKAGHRLQIPSDCVCRWCQQQLVTSHNDRWRTFSEPHSSSAWAAFPTANCCAAVEVCNHRPLRNCLHTGNGSKQRHFCCK